MEISLPIAVALTAAGSLASGAAVFAVMRYRLSAAEKAIDLLDDRIDEARSLAVKALGELADFKIEATRQFVTDEMLVKVEGRVVEAINRLADRLDRLLESRRPRAGQS